MNQRLRTIGAGINGLAVAFRVVAGGRGVHLKRHADFLAAVIPAAACYRPQVARLRTHVPHCHLRVAFKAAARQHDAARFDHDACMISVGSLDPDDTFVVVREQSNRRCLVLNLGSKPFELGAQCLNNREASANDAWQSRPYGGGQRIHARMRADAVRPKPLQDFRDAVDERRQHFGVGEGSAFTRAGHDS